jgi:hypothetical protein
MDLLQLTYWVIVIVMTLGSLWGFTQTAWGPSRFFSAPAVVLFIIIGLVIFHQHV